MSTRPRVMSLCSIAIATLAAALAPAASAAQDAVQGRAAQDTSPQGDERPLDPAGQAATTAGPAASLPLAIGPFMHVQVNLATNGSNILGDAANEPSIAVDPTAPNRMAIGWRQFDTTTSNFRQAGYGYSVDGGRTWSAGVLTPGTFRSDPVLEADSHGNFYYNSLATPGGNFLTDVFRSRDAGRTWDAPVAAFGGDKAWMHVDKTGGPSDGHVYCAWSRFAGCCGQNTFTRSTDGGATYETPVPTAPIFGTLATALDGTLYVGGVDPSDFTRFLVARSTSARDPQATPTFTTSSFTMGGSLALQEPPNPAGIAGQIHVSVNPCNDEVYVLASLVSFGPDPLDVFFVRSADGGATWSPPIRVNDDALGAYNWFGTMSVAPNGRIDAIWNDTRNTGQANLCELFHSSSIDGGLTWSPNQAISPVWDSHLAWPNQNKIGDYYELVSDAVGAHLAWAATFNGEQDVYYTRIGDYDCNNNGTSDTADLASGASLDTNTNGIPDECECYASHYCTSTVNSSGQAAHIDYAGSLSAGAGALTLLADGIPPGQFGIFFYGGARDQMPLGDGFLCVDAGAPALFRLPTIVQADGAGHVSLALDFGAPPLDAGPGRIDAFSTWNFQLWYRDPGGGPTRTNLSDALELTFCP